MRNDLEKLAAVLLGIPIICLVATAVLREVGGWIAVGGFLLLGLRLAAWTSVFGGLYRLNWVFPSWRWWVRLITRIFFG